MPKSINSTQPPLQFIPQAFNPLIVQTARWLVPLILRFRTRDWLPAGIVDIQGQNVETLARLYQEFQAGKIRFLIAFRHPEVEDPLCMLYVMTHILPGVARQQGIQLRKPIHSHFLYDRGMTIWAGNWLGWLFSQLGGVPIRRGRRVDRNAIQTARDLFAHAHMPIAVAPEGGNNGHSGIVSSLEPGVAQLGFWCVEDLEKAHRSEEVLILPVDIQYRYIQPPWLKINWLLNKLEADSGLPVMSASTIDEPEFYQRRVYRLAEYLITQMEEFYRRFYHQDIPVSAMVIPRLHYLMDIALKVAEEYFALSPQGTLIDRCRRLEEVGWNYIYRDDIADIKSLPPFQRGLADWVAQEADLRMQHMRLVESFVAIGDNYWQHPPNADRLAETTLLIFDMLSRIQESTLPGRPCLGQRRAIITIGNPISVTQRWQQTQGNRGAMRQATSQLTRDLQTVLESMIP